jgi:hypothetical protein
MNGIIRSVSSSNSSIYMNNENVCVQSVHQSNIARSTNRNIDENGDENGEENRDANSNAQTIQHLLAKVSMGNCVYG